MGDRDTEMAAAENTFWVDTFEEHGSSILAFLTSRVGRRDLAEDLLQETFVRVMRQGRRIADGARIKSYLFTTAHHLVLDQARRKRPALFSEISEASAPAPELTLVDRTSASPDALADLGRFQERLEAALADLSPAHRIAFRSAVLEQRPYAQVARENGWSLEQVKTNVHRARKKIVAEMREVLRPDAERTS